MPQLSLTEFVDIVYASGILKALKVGQAKNRPPYDPARDFYKRIREDIIVAHQNDQGKTYIDGILPLLTDQKKMTDYPLIVAGYKKWWGKKSLIWFNPPSTSYSNSGVAITVNPELGLDVNGTPHLIKLHFKSAPLAKNRVEIITHLMAITTSTLCPSPSTTVMSILDVRRGQLFSPAVPIPGMTDILNAELAYIAKLWASV
jgi:hypothetical protein